MKRVGDSGRILKKIWKWLVRSSRMLKRVIGWSAPYGHGSVNGSDHREPFLSRAQRKRLFFEFVSSLPERRGLAIALNRQIRLSLLK
jgi:hypothetical protein